MLEHHATLRPSLLALSATLAVFIVGCGGRTATENPGRNHPESDARDVRSLEARTFALESPTTVVGYGAGSLWVTDLGDYRCDDTPGIEADCASPKRAYLKRLDPGTLEVQAEFPLEDTDHTGTVAFGAAAAPGSPTRTTPHHQRAACSGWTWTRTRYRTRYP